MTTDPWFLTSPQNWFPGRTNASNRGISGQVGRVPAKNTLRMMIGAWLISGRGVLSYWMQLVT